MVNLIEIAQGWYGMIHASPELKTLAEERLVICNECPQRKIVNSLAAAGVSLAYCGQCGCPLSSKTLSRDSHCPLDKW